MVFLTLRMTRPTKVLVHVPLVEPKLQVLLLTYAILHTRLYEYASFGLLQSGYSFMPCLKHPWHLSNSWIQLERLGHLANLIWLIP